MIDIERLKVDESLWPDEATHYVIDQDGVSESGFHVEIAKGYKELDSDAYWPKSAPRLLLIPRPEPKQEWVDGLPPVGSECVLAYPFVLCGTTTGKRMEAGDTVIVQAHVDLGFGLVCLITDKDIDGSGTIIRENLLPIPTKEEREREELIDLLHNDNPVEVNADAIIAAGWRKADE